MSTTPWINTTIKSLQIYLLVSCRYNVSVCIQNPDMMHLDFQQSFTVQENAVTQKVSSWPSASPALSTSAPHSL